MSITTHVFWEDSVRKVTEISNEFYHKGLDIEFWKNQPTVVLSLISDMYDKLENTKRY